MRSVSDQSSTSTSRRAFVKGMSLAGALFGLMPAAVRAASPVPHASSAPAIQQYKRLGSTNIKLADISFGGSRLRRDVRLVEHAFARGINYFDTAESYTGGDSEETIGQALHGKRDKVYLTSKSHFDADTRQQEMMRTLEGSLRRLRTDYIDVYFNHAVNDVGRLQNPEFYTFAQRAKEQGKIRYVGLSGHGGRLIECLEYAIQRRAYDVMLVAYNFGQDPSFLQSLTSGFDFIAINQELPRVLRQAKQAGMGVIAMKTLRGARLNSMEPYQKDGATFSQAAFRWVLSNRDVDALVVTMRSADQVDEFVAASGGVKVTQTDRRLLHQYAALNDATYCRPLCNACEASCPQGVPIADVLRHKMYFEDYGDERVAREQYSAFVRNASACVSCAHEQCVGACPGGLSIPELTRRAHRVLAI